MAEKLPSIYDLDKIVKGDFMYGYYGKGTVGEETSKTVCNALKITEGRFIDKKKEKYTRGDEPLVLHKFSYLYQVVYIPDQNLKTNVSFLHVQDNGLTANNRFIELDGKKYGVRLIMADNIMNKADIIESSGVATDTIIPPSYRTGSTPTENLINYYDEKLVKSEWMATIGNSSLIEDDEAENEFNLEGMKTFTLGAPIARMENQINSSGDKGRDSNTLIDIEDTTGAAAFRPIFFELPFEEKEEISASALSPIASNITVDSITVKARPTGAKVLHNGKIYDSPHTFTKLNHNSEFKFKSAIVDGEDEILSESEEISIKTLIKWNTSSEKIDPPQMIESGYGYLKIKVPEGLKIRFERRDYDGEVKTFVRLHHDTEYSFYAVKERDEEKYIEEVVSLPLKVKTKKITNPTITNNITELVVRTPAGTKVRYNGKEYTSPYTVSNLIHDKVYEFQSVVIKNKYEIYDQHTDAVSIRTNFGPGSKSIKSGNSRSGYFGTLSDNEFTSLQNIIDSFKMTTASISESSSQHSNWAKFYYRGNVMYFRKMEYIYNVNSNTLDALGLDGTKSFILKNDTYKVRPPKGTSYGSKLLSKTLNEVTSDKLYLSDSEASELLVPLTNRTGNTSYYDSHTKWESNTITGSELDGSILYETLFYNNDHRRLSIDSSSGYSYKTYSVTSGGRFRPMVILEQPKTTTKEVTPIYMRPPTALNSDGKPLDYYLDEVPEGNYPHTEK